MSGLPEGWESDYDGSRWFYRFRPTGQTQYTFPHEGDEFPDYVDELAPVPDLAPEEKLESQQQVKRRTTTGNTQDVKAPATRARMQATAGPLGGGMGFGGPHDDNEDDDGGGFYYQPESFMFLGPGAYNDVSPLADEDDREEVGAKPPEPQGKNMKTAEDVDRSSRVSPIQSEATTPLVLKSEPASGSPAIQDPTTAVTPSDASAVNTPDVQLAPAQPASPVVHLLDSREMPHELPASMYYSPVGFVAEMPTEDTPRAHIESHPDPVEMGDSSVLAPIEVRTVALQTGIAELAEHTSPVEPKSLIQSHDELQQTNMSPQLLHQATFGTQARPQGASPPPSKPNVSQAPPQALQDQKPAQPETQHAASTADQAFKITRKPTISGPRSNSYQAYAPGTGGPASAPATEAVAPRVSGEGQAWEGRRSLEREGSLMIGSGAQSSYAKDIPASLQPPRMPAQQSQQTTAEQPAVTAGSRQASVNVAQVSQKPVEHAQSQDGSLGHVPSVLKPGPRRNPPGATPSQEAPSRETIPPLGSIGEANHPGHPVGYRPLDASMRAQTAPPVQVAPPYPVGGNAGALTSRYSHHAAPGPRPGVNRVQTEPVEPPYPVTPQPHRATLVDQQRYAVRSEHPDAARSPPVPAKRPHREHSIAYSDVSSLGPSDGQTPAAVQTPSPLDNARRSSSGFFQPGDVSTPSSLSDATSASQSPFPHNGIPTRREVGQRSSSFSVVPSSQNGAAGAAAAQSSSVQTPPAVPAKVPLQHDASNLTEAQRPQAQAVSTATERRHSVPPHQMAQTPSTTPGQPQNQTQLPPGQSFSVRQNEIHGSAWGLQQDLPMRPKEPQQPHQAQQRRADGASALGGGGQPQNRPQRPTVVPPNQSSRLSMSIPPSPGHLLHVIQESPESEQHQARFIPREGLAPDQRPPLATHQSQPLSTPGPLGAQQSPAVNSPAASLPMHGPPPGQPAGSPMQHRPMMPPQPGQFHQRTMSSPVQGGPPMDMRKDEKKEKSGWLSKLRGNPNKPGVLQKQPPQSVLQQHPSMQQPPWQQVPMQQPPGSYHYPNQQAFHDQNRPPGAMNQFQPPPQVQHQAPWQASPAQAVPPQGWNQQSVAPAGGKPGRPLSLVGPPAPQGPAPPEQRSSLDSRRDPNQFVAPPPAQTMQQEVHHQATEPQRGHSQAPQTSLGRNISDASMYAASISTVDISEAQAQPMLKGHLVSVRRPGQHQRSGSAGPGQQAQQVQSPISGHAQSRYPSGPAQHGRMHSNTETNPNNTPGTPMDRTMVVPPLFSASQQAASQQVPAHAYGRDSVVSDVSYQDPRASVVSDVSYQDPRASVVSAMSVQSSAHGGPARRPSASKWERRPAADYSGDDWPEDDWERY